MPTSIPASLRFFRAICWIGVVIWVGTVFYLSSCSSAELIEDLPFLNKMWDKALHFIAFFCGVLPLVPALRLSMNWPWRKICIVAVCATSLYAALDEVHQYWTP